MRKATFVVATLALGCATGGSIAADCGYESEQGDAVTFREAFAGGEKYGYQLWYRSPSIAAQHLDYATYVGSRGKVIGDIESSFDTRFKKVLLETCEIVYGFTGDGTMPTDVYRDKDLAEAKGILGETVWVNQAFVARALELVTLDSGVSYPIGHLEPLTVVDVYLPRIGHARGSAPLFLIARKTTGEEGYIPFNKSYVYTKDPIPTGTHPRIAEAIRGQKVLLGMTAEQVTVSWGKPEDVNRSVGSWGVHEQWVYGDQYVYLEDGKVTSFQD